MEAILPGLGEHYQKVGKALLFLTEVGTVYVPSSAAHGRKGLVLWNPIPSPTYLLSGTLTGLHLHSCLDDEKKTCSFLVRSLHISEV